MKLHLDFETYSEVDLRQVGMYRYAEDPSTELLCASYAFDDGPVILWTPGPPPEDVVEHVQRGRTIYAHNAMFEWLMMKNQVGWPTPSIRQMRCTAAMAAAAGLPRKMEAACQALGMPGKISDGVRLINKLCKPRKPSKNNQATRWIPETAPDDFLKLYQYCRGDTKAERSLADALWELIAREQEMWFLDARINRRGIPVDKEALDAALVAVRILENKLNAEVAEVTGGVLEKATQREKFLQYFEDNGHPLTGFTRADIEEFLRRRGVPKFLHRLAELRLELSKISTRKLQAFKRTMCRDGRIHGTLLYCGAERTGRWAGLLIQPHNFPRGEIDDPDTAIDLLTASGLDGLEMAYDQPMVAISSSLRGIIAAPLGRIFLVGDYKGIEARVLVWLAGQKDILKIYQEGGDPYAVMAMDLCGVDRPEDLDAGQMFLGKTTVLGCGFGMGAATFRIQLRDNKLPEDQADDAVETFRMKYHRVVSFWYGLERACMKAIRTGRAIKYKRLRIGVRNDFLIIILPSGRPISYYKPRILPRETPWGEEKDAITFMGLDHFNYQWSRLHTYSGRLAENVTQAVARDVMAEGIRNAETNDFEVVTNVHDEIIAEEDEGERTHEEFCRIICKMPSWADGLPLVAKGYTARRYRK